MGKVLVALKQINSPRYLKEDVPVWFSTGSAGAVADLFPSPHADFFGESHDAVLGRSAVSVHEVKSATLSVYNDH